MAAPRTVAFPAVYDASVVKPPPAKKPPAVSSPAAKKTVATGKSTVPPAPVLAAAPQPITPPLVSVAKMSQKETRACFQEIHKLQKAGRKPHCDMVLRNGLRFGEFTLEYFILFHQRRSERTRRREEEEKLRKGEEEEQEEEDAELMADMGGEGDSMSDE